MSLNLASRYRSDIDLIDETAWNKHLRSFDDASVYQTWSYGRLKVGDAKLSHVALWCQNELTAMCQVRIKRLPPLPMGIAYVHWGPLWVRTGSAPNLDHLRNMIRALREEFVLKRRLDLRILPKVVEPRWESEICRVFKEEGFDWSPDPDQTFIIDLTRSLKDIRDSLHRDWRRDLRNAEKQDLRLIEGTSAEIMATAVSLAEEMKKRKKYFRSRTFDLSKLQEELPEDSKFKVVYAEHQGKPVAALGWQTLGNVGFPLIAATGDRGLKLKASFLLWWKMIEFYHERGFRCLDVGGVHAGRNPGGYLFKSRLTGKKDPLPDRYAGQFICHRGQVSPLLFQFAYVARNVYKHTRARITKVLHTKSPRTNSRT